MTRAPRRGFLGATGTAALALTALALPALAQQPQPADANAPAVGAAAPAVVAPVAVGPQPALPAIAVPAAAPQAPAGTPLQTLESRQGAQARPPQAEPLHGTRGLVVGVFLAAIAGGAWLWKKSREKPSRGGPVPSLRVLSRLSVGYRSELLVIDLEGRQILLGMTPGSIQALTELPDERDRADARDELALGPDVTFSESLRAAAGAQPRRPTQPRMAGGPPSGQWPEDRVEAARGSAEGPASRRTAVDAPASRRLEARAAEPPASYEAPLEQQVRGLARRRNPRDA